MTYGDKVQLGKITKVSICDDDHGGYTFWLQIDFGSTFQSFGGYALGTENVAFKEGMAIIIGLMKAFNCNWEDLKGKVVIAERNQNNDIVALSQPAFEGKGRFAIGDVFPERKDVYPERSI